MSDNIPFDIQMDIIKRVYDVKSLIRFRSVSKPWKSFIDSSQFIKGYDTRHTRHTQPHCRILSSEDACFLDEAKYFFLVDDDNNETLKVQKQELAPFVMSPLLKQYRVSHVVGACHGLLCYYGFNNDYKNMLVIWNPSVRKSFGIALPEYVPRTPTQTFYGFGVCPVNLDPTVLKILIADNMPWHVEVFTLSLGVWNVIPSGNLPRQLITLKNLSTQVVIDRFIYWVASEKTLTDDGVPHYKYMVVSFDLITKEFKVVDIPDTITNELLTSMPVSVYELRGSLVVCGYMEAEVVDCGLWVMEHDSSFKKLFTIHTPGYKLLGFKKNGETIFATRKKGTYDTLFVCDPCSQRIKYLGISGEPDSFYMCSYNESLCLLNHLDSRVYLDNAASE